MSSAQEEKMEIMWTEKYRPKKLSDIINHEEIKQRLQGFVKSKNLPHLLFAGPPGTGKTSAGLALANEIFGESSIRNNLLELNASDDRGIDTIRNQVKEFARTLPSGGASFKIIMLDEADSLTPAAQQALRRTMERYAETSRFILLCNYPGKIIEPIQSRCAFFRFTPIPETAIKEKLIEIAKHEKVDYSEDGLKTLIAVSNGDMRKALNIMQATVAYGEKITKQTVYATVGTIDPKEIADLVNQSKSSFPDALKTLQDLIYVRGVSGEDILRLIFNFIDDLNLDNEVRIELIELLAEVDFRLTEGTSPDIQIGMVLAKIAQFL